MRYVVDRMTLGDIPRIVEIEKLAYSTPWPPSAYRNELQDNRMAHYIVVRDKRLSAIVAAQPEVKEAPRRPFPFSWLNNRATQITPAAASIVGFAGLWLMMDEAHITTIAAHPAYRGRGVGELMLSSLIGIAYTIHADRMTLEVRVSNTVAQNLYRKYGFKEEGRRRRYYSDNNEDAYIMTTESIDHPGYVERFSRLRAQLLARLEADDQPAFIG
ncbi:MAG TPA: ribosomal protein S18-alanine N-acetyltransferase [Ktedonobacterales bacterium]|nr:ribosomal protein S18-alanine N-acetyltransferase [Ktedonobacterales bacterium]